MNPQQIIKWWAIWWIGRRYGKGVYALKPPIGFSPWDKTPWYHWGCIRYAFLHNLWRLECKLFDRYVNNEEMQ